MFVSDWITPIVAVGALGLATLLFAFVVGRWIDAQGRSVVDEPRAARRARALRTQAPNDPISDVTPQAEEDAS